MRSRLAAKARRRGLRQVVLWVSIIGCASLSAENSDIHVYSWTGAKGAIDELIEHYEQHTGLGIDFRLIEPTRYGSNSEESQIYNNEVAIFLLPPQTENRFLDAGWIDYFPAEKMYEQLNADLYKNAREGMLYQGGIPSLKQFATTTALPLVDVQRYRELELELGLDLAGLPADWHSLYEQMNELENAGYKDIFLPHCFDGVFGPAWGFVAEVLNRGGHIVDPATHSVVMDERAGPAFDTLSDWRLAIESGAAGASSVDMSYPEYVSAFHSGKYAVNPQAT